MAEVYLAQAVGPEGFAKDVVIKVVRSFLASDQQFIDMFINEARLSSRLNHANVVQIFDFGKHEQSYFIAMEYVRGTSLYDLRARCRDRGVPFPPTLVAEIGAQVARGLGYAHGLSEKGKPLNIVHRDVTPHNVLLSFDGAVKLTDFGIAKASTTHTAPGILKGKFAYMAPEQARGEPVDARTDLFALGIVLWEMLTGGRLFDGDTELAVLRAVQESLIAPPNRLNADVPQDLSDIIVKALSRPPASRYQTAFEMDKALATFVLRAARSVEDTSVPLFLQQVYRDELERETEEHERPATPLGVPAIQRGLVPQANSFGLGDTLAVDRSTELAQGRPRTEAMAATPSKRPVPDSTLPLRGPARTEQMMAATSEPPPRTEQPQAPRQSRPLPVSDGLRGPTDLVPQLKLRPEPAASTPQRPGSDSGTIRVSESMKLEVVERGAALRRAEPNEPLTDPRVAAAPSAEAFQPTVLKPRALTLDLKPEPSNTTPAEPEPVKRSAAVLMGSVAAAVVVFGGVGYALLGRGGSPAAQPDVEVVKTTAVGPEPIPAPKALMPVPIAVEPQASGDAGALQAGGLQVVPGPGVDEVKPAAATNEAAAPEQKPVAPAIRFGMVAVKAVPFAEVLIDGKKFSEVQGTGKVRVPFGAHRLTLRHPKRSESFELVIDGKSTPEISFSASGN